MCDNCADTLFRAYKNKESFTLTPGSYEFQAVKGALMTAFPDVYRAVMDEESPATTTDDEDDAEGDDDTEEAEKTPVMPDTSGILAEILGKKLAAEILQNVKDDAGKKTEEQPDKTAVFVKVAPTYNDPGARLYRINPPSRDVGEFVVISLQEKMDDYGKYNALPARASGIVTGDDPWNGLYAASYSDLVGMICHRYKVVDPGDR